MTELIYSWQHHFNGELIGEIRRSMKNGKKEDIPCYKPAPQGFAPGIPDSMKGQPYPLLGTEAVRDRHQIVIGCEGQKAQAAFVGLDFQSVTNILGAGKAHLSDFGWLDGCKTVYLMPDNDAPGEKHMRDIYAILSRLKTPPAMAVVRLPGLPPKGDICDWLKQQPELADWNEYDSLADHPAKDAIRERLLSAINSAASPIPGEWWQPDKNIEPMAAPVAMPLQRKLAAPTPFPTKALGPHLAPLACRIAEVIQAPAGLIGNSLLAAATLAVQPFANLIIDGRIIPLSNFFVTLGQSGERKTGVDAIALQPHRQKQQDLAELYKIDYIEYLLQSKAYDSQVRIITANKKASHDEMSAKLRNLGPRPLPPLDHIILMEDPTFEGMIKLLETGQPSIGLFADEGGRLIGGNAMNAENALKTAAGLSKLWDGATIDRVRVEGGAVALPGRRLSMHLMVQPQIGQLMLSDAMMKEQGLLSRCLVTWPASTVGNRRYVRANITQMPEYEAYMAQMMAILNTPYPLAQGARNQLEPRHLLMAPDAYDLWVMFHDEVELRQAEGGLFKPIQGFASKAAEHAGRLAGVLALMDDLNCKEIRKEHVEAAIQLVSHYLNEALRLFDAGLVEPELKLAEELLAWLKPRLGEVVTLTEIYQSGPNPLRSAATAQRIVNILVEHGYMAPVTGGGFYRNKRCRTAYRVLEVGHV